MAARGGGKIHRRDSGVGFRAGLQLRRRNGSRDPGVRARRRGAPPDYITSFFTRPEWTAYFAQDPTSEQRQIFPVRIRECELKGLLKQIVCTDLVGKEEAEAKRELLAAAKIGRRKPTSAPAFFGRSERAILSQPRFFGALPDIWNVPHLRNPNFTEPGQRLTDLCDALRSGRPAALAGLGGVGKTQLAVEYAFAPASRNACSGLCSARGAARPAGKRREGTARDHRRRARCPAAAARLAARLRQCQYA